MLLLEVDSARVVKGIVEALVDLVPEALFDFSPDGGLSLWVSTVGGFAHPIDYHSGGF